MEKAYLHSSAKSTNSLKIDLKDPTVVLEFISSLFLKSNLAVILLVSLKLYNSP